MVNGDGNTGGEGRVSMGSDTPPSYKEKAQHPQNFWSPLLTPLRSDLERPIFLRRRGVFLDVRHASS